jgi:hypothetical protein
MLDTLYSQVLSAAPRCGNSERVIGTIMLLVEPLPIIYVGYLLRLEPAEVLQALLGLQSIISIPGDDNHPVRLFHTSLRDFLSAQPRSGLFYIDPPTRHLCIATDCLTAITIQQEDGVVYDRAQEYACWNWCEHFLQGLAKGGGDNLFGSPSGAAFMSCLMNFASWFLDFWVNIWILKRNFPQLLELLGSVRSKLNVSQIFLPSPGFGSDPTTFLLAGIELPTKFVADLGRYRGAYKGAMSLLVSQTAR